MTDENRTTHLERIERPEIVEDAPMEQVINEQFIAALEKAAALYQERYLPVCFKMTNSNDWINHGTPDKPKISLQTPGAEKLCNPLGIVWDKPNIIKHILEDDRGKYYEIECEGIIQSRRLQRYGWFTGNCSSRDQFFVARGNFDEGDIRKSAFSNWILNGVSRLAGLRNPSIPMLEKAGLNISEITRVEYRGGPKTPDQAKGKISEPQVKRLYAIMGKHKVTDTDVREKHALKSLYDIERGAYETICAWVETRSLKKEDEGERQGALPGD